MPGWRNFGFCETPRVLIGLARCVRLRLRGYVAVPRLGQQYGWQRAWPLVSRAGQSHGFGFSNA
jgi:hypothetical protein